MKIRARIIAFGAAILCGAAYADQFSDSDLKQRDAECLTVVQQGRALFTDPRLGKNSTVCAQCRPNAANTHPETYPKFQKQFGQVAQLAEMVNWCIRNPLEGRRWRWTTRR